MDFDLSSADVTTLTTGVTNIFVEIVDFVVVIAPIAILVTVGWYGVRWLRGLLRGSSSSVYLSDSFRDMELKGRGYQTGIRRLPSKKL